MRLPKTHMLKKNLANKSFWYLARIQKSQNRFLEFLSNLVLRPTNLKSSISKNPKSIFSRKNSSFFLTKILILDFVLGRRDQNRRRSRSPRGRGGGGGGDRDQGRRRGGG